MGNAHHPWVGHDRMVGIARSTRLRCFWGSWLSFFLFTAAGPPAFRDVAAESGLVFRFDNGSRGRHDLPEIMGGGVALIDFDGDGWLDVYLCNGGPIGPEPGQADPPCRLFRNQGDGTFVDVTERAGAPGPSYAMGAAVADYDGDGHDDLFVTGWRDQRLYRNLGGRFEDVTERAGLVSNLWSTSAAFADLDRDGDLDLYVANYLDYDPAHAPFCAAPDGGRDYCAPEDFPAQPDRLYRNNGDGTFTDVSKSSGIDRPEGRGLGVVIADLTGDSLLDIYVANDGTPCWLFENRGALRFEEVGGAAGVAVDGQGRALSGMGVTVGDLDGDARPDLVVTNFLGRSTVAFQGRAGGAYLDASAALGLTAATRDVLGFGVALIDFDGDGDLDLFQANGHVLDRARLGVPFAMRSLLLENHEGRFRDISAQAGPWFSRPILGRGVAVGDLDHDGRPDVVVNALNAPAALLRNVAPTDKIIALELIGRAPGHHQPFGARVRATIAGRVLERDLVGGGSYLSASECRVALGLGGAKKIHRLEVAWPSGRVEVWNDLEGRPRLRVEEGTGTPQ
jgi:hypothetical protein